MKNLLLSLVAAGSLLAAAPPASAQADPLLGQVTVFGFNFCPRGWTEADGKLLSIAQYSAVFSLFGTTFGGDGRTTFGVPDLRGRSMVGVGVGAGADLPPVTWGQKGGTVSIQLTESTMPSHSHLLVGSEEDATSGDPANGFPAVTGTPSYTTSAGSPANMSGGAIANAGGGQPFDKRSPYLGMQTCVALQGVFPSRN